MCRWVWFLGAYGKFFCINTLKTFTMTKEQIFLNRLVPDAKVRTCSPL